MGSNTTLARPAAQRTTLGFAALVLAAATFLSEGCGGHAAAPQAEDAAAFASASPGATGPAGFYITNVVPVFRANCYRCHGGANHRGGLKLDTPQAIAHGGQNGAVVVPGHPEQSLLIRLIRHEGPADDPMPMPPRSKLSDADINTVAAWIQAGAKMP